MFESIGQIHSRFDDQFFCPGQQRPERSALTFEHFGFPILNPIDH